METEEGLDARLSKAYRQLFGESENDMSAEEIARLLSAVVSKLPESMHVAVTICITSP